MEKVACVAEDNQAAIVTSFRYVLLNKSIHAGIGKFENSIIIEPTTNSGILTKKPSLIETRYLFLLIALAIGISLDSSLFVKLDIVHSPFIFVSSI